MGCERSVVTYEASVCGGEIVVDLDLRAGTHWRQSRKDVRHSGDKNYPLSTKSTELIMFNFGDNVDREPATLDFRQNGNKSATKSEVNVVDRVDLRLFRQCVPALK